MRTTYGVVWRNGSGPLGRGKLELLPRVVRLDGVSGDERVTLEIPYEELESVRTGRAPADRLNGRPTLVLERHGRPPVVVSAVAQTGVIAEVTEHLAKLALD